MRLSGKSALVTGAGSGIGRATALAFAQEGARVIAADIDRESLASLRAEQSSIQTEVLNVTDTAEVENCSARTGHISVLVNGVGTVHNGSILECTDADWAAAIMVNLSSVMYVTRAYLPRMVSAGGGTIINIASVASSVRGVPSRFAYSATKAGVIGLTKSVSADFVTKGIRCNVICPGTIDTPSLKQRLRDTGDEVTARATFIARQPMGRLGTAQEVAALAVHLASDESAFTTGAVHVIDGGWTT